jgi:hypothetical protein
VPYQSGSSSSSSDAAANVRSAIPALEAYFADNGTYAGVTPAKLRSVYDPSIGEVGISGETGRTYCVESTVGGETYSKRGPAADVLPGGC